MARPLDTEKEASIIQAAIACFGEQGFAGTTIKDIAQKAGIAIGTVYTYFPDKEKVFRAAVEQTWNNFFEGMNGIFQLPGPLYDKLGRLIDFGMDIFVRLYPIVRGMFEQATKLDLIKTNLDRLARQLSIVLLQAQSLQGTSIPPEATQASKQIPEQNQPLERVRPLLVPDSYNLKIMIYGIIFSLATVERDQLEHEIDRLRVGIRELMKNYGLVQTGQGALV